MEIALNKEKVFDDVKMNVSIIARDYKDEQGNSLYDRLFIQERDTDILESFWESALSFILSEISIFVKSSTPTNIVLEIHRYNQNSIADLSDLFNNFLMNKIVESWLSLKAVSYAAVYSNKAEENLASVKNRLFYKVEAKLKSFDRP